MTPHLMNRIDYFASRPVPADFTKPIWEQSGLIPP
jgi:hypothetical protein